MKKMSCNDLNILNFYFQQLKIYHTRLKNQRLKIATKSIKRYLKVTDISVRNSTQMQWSI